MYLFALLCGVLLVFKQGKYMFLEATKICNGGARKLDLDEESAPNPRNSSFSRGYY